MMRRALIYFVVMVLLLPLNVAADEDETGSIIDVLATLTVSAPAVALPDLEGREVIVAVENVYPPFNQITIEGEAVGWDYDAIGEICARLNCQPQFIEHDWETLIASVSEGVFDLSGNGVTVTEERRDIVDFSEPYILLQQFLVVRINETRFSTIEEFLVDDNLTVSAFTDSTNLDLAYELLGEDSPRVRDDGTLDQMILSIMNFETDALLVDNLVAERIVAQNADVLRVIDEPLTDEEALAFIFTPGSDLVAAFDAALAQMRADGTLDEINTRWFSGETE